MDTFENWMKSVDRIIANNLAGLTSQDLPDQCYMEWYEDEVSPKEAAKMAIEYANKAPE